MKTKTIWLTIMLATILWLNPVLAGTPEAVTYLQGQTQDAWITQGLIASGDTNVSTDHLTSVTETSYPTTDYAKAILALTAVGENPATFGNIDYVAKLKSYYDGTQMGSADLLNDDIWSILALASIREADSVEAQSAKDFLLANQNDDGGWGYGVGVASDSNDTATAIMALMEAGVDAGDSSITDAIAYLQTTQNDDGGFTYDPTSEWGTASDSGSDAWVISAIYKVGQDPITWVKGENGENNPLTHLNSLQDDADGGFWWVTEGTSEWNNKSMTAYVVIALAEKSFPVAYYDLPPTYHLTIKGSNSVICDKYIDGPSALDIVENAASICNYTYNIDTTEFGPYLNQIGDDTAEGLVGWLYYINGESLMVGADQYTLNEGDEVLWYYGEWDWENVTMEEGDNSEVAVELSVPMSLVIPAGITDATVNVSSLANDDGTNVTATLPQITLSVTTEISATPVEVVIPADTVITAPAGWNGIINAPTIQDSNSVTVVPDSGNTASVSSVIEVGYGDTELTFSKAVRLLIPGATGKNAGYSRNDTFTKITAVCTEDSQTAGDALDAGSDCKIDVGSDLVIWTKHFTKFISYTQATEVVAPSGSVYVPLPPSTSSNNSATTTDDVDEETEKLETNSEEETEKLEIDDEKEVKEIEKLETDNEISAVLGEKIKNPRELQLEQISIDANLIITELKVERDLTKENEITEKYIDSLVENSELSTENITWLTNFVTYGTVSTRDLNINERADVLSYYQNFFNKLPTTQVEWSDALKVANGRWTAERNKEVEDKAVKEFKKIYLKNPDRLNFHDDAVINLIAYGLRPTIKNLNSEKAGSKIFTDIYGYTPVSSSDLAIVRAIAYSGATR